MAATILSPQPHKTLLLQIPFLGDSAESSTMSVQRWDGNERTATEWNSLRRDDELWMDHGECYVFLYRPGHSQRGPSFRLPYELLVKASCNDLLDHHLISTWNSSPYSPSCPGGECYLYLHAPADLSREESFQYHLDTRNFFAWIVGVPLVGADPVSALERLKDRMDVWRDRPSDNLGALIAYVEAQGYCDMSDPVEQSFHKKKVEPQNPPRRKRDSLMRLFKISTPTYGKRMADMLIGTPRRTTEVRRRLSMFSATESTQDSSHTCDDVSDYNYDTELEEDRMSIESSYSESSSPPPLVHSRKESMSSSISSDHSLRSSSPSTPQTPEFAKRDISSGRETTMRKETPSADRIHNMDKDTTQEKMIDAMIAELREGRDGC